MPWSVEAPKFTVPVKVLSPFMVWLVLSVVYDPEPPIAMILVLFPEPSSPNP